MAVTEQQAVQNDKNVLYHELRHLCSLCNCPSYVSINELKLMIAILKGEK